MIKIMPFFLVFLLSFMMIKKDLEMGYDVSRLIYFAFWFFSSILFLVAGYCVGRLKETQVKTHTFRPMREHDKL